MNESNTNEPVVKKKRRGRFASFSLRALLLLTLLAALALGFLNYTVAPRLRAQTQLLMIGEYVPWPLIDDSSSDVNLVWRKIYDFAGLKIDFDRVTQVDDYDGELPDLKFAYLTPNLEFLATCSKSVDDLSPLTGLAKLGTLRIDHTSVTDLSPLAGNSSLWDFSASCTSIKDFSPLRNLDPRSMQISQVELEDLNLLFPRGVEDLSFYLINLRSLKGIDAFKNLTSLRFDRCKLADGNWNALKQLAGHKSLRWIRIQDAEMKNLDFINEFSADQPSDSAFDSLEVAGIHFSELAEIPTCNSIKYLSLVGCKADQLEKIPGFKRLDRLVLDGAEFGALVEVGEMPELTELSMNHSKTQSHDWIKKFHLIERLEMSNTNFTDVSLLSGLSELQGLNISKSSVESLSGLPVANLNKLDLSGTKIKELSPLQDAKKLKKLNLESTLVVDLDPISQCELEALNLSHTKIKSLKSLNIMKLKSLVLKELNSRKKRFRIFERRIPFAKSIRIGESMASSRIRLVDFEF